MANGATVILAATKSERKSQSFSLTQASHNQTATVICSGLTSTNKAYLQVYNPVTSAFINVKINGSDVYCDANNSVIYVSGNGRYRIDKQGADEVGVAVISDMPYDVISVTEI